MRVLPNPVRFVFESDHVHDGATIDGIGQHVRSRTEVHLAVGGEIFAENIFGLGHGDQATIDVLPREGEAVERVVRFENELTNPAPDPIATDDGISLGGRAILKEQSYRPRRLGLETR